MQGQQKITGTVRVWRNSWGFIAAHDCDYFVHQSNIDMPGFRELTVGERVEFEVAETERGPMAVRVKRLDGRTASHKHTC